MTNIKVDPGRLVVMKNRSEGGKGNSIQSWLKSAARTLAPALIPLSVAGCLGQPAYPTYAPIPNNYGARPYYAPYAYSGPAGLSRGGVVSQFSDNDIVIMPPIKSQNAAPAEAGSGGMADEPFEAPKAIEDAEMARKIPGPAAAAAGEEGAGAFVAGEAGAAGEAAIVGERLAPAVVEGGVLEWLWEIFLIFPK